MFNEAKEGPSLPSFRFSQTSGFLIGDSSVRAPLKIYLSFRPRSLQSLRSYRRHRSIQVRHSPQHRLFTACVPLKSPHTRHKRKEIEPVLTQGLGRNLFFPVLFSFPVPFRLPSGIEELRVFKPFLMFCWWVYSEGEEESSSSFSFFLCPSGGETSFRRQRLSPLSNSFWQESPEYSNLAPIGRLGPRLGGRTFLVLSLSGWSEEGSSSSFKI